jgi:sigma-B regulation protein RsbU (phosphoserine phosphatase)
MTKILIVDDDSSIQILLERTLTRQGYEVLLAQDGQAGLLAAQANRPSLIICDWLMPGMDGLEVCRAVKSNPDLATTFFVLLTSMGSVADRVKGLDAGADDFLCKPIEMNELIARVRAGLRLHQLSHDLQAQKLLLETELAEAADYVGSILPEPLFHRDVEIYGHFIPSRQLGGDGFDYFFLDGDRLVFYLLDVSGHGLGAALPAISIVNLLRTQGLSGVDYSRPEAILTELNNSFPMTFRNDKYFTIWYGVFDFKRRILTYASAGHPPAILLCPDDCQWQEIELKTRGFPVGMFAEAEYTSQTCSIVPSSSLYLFSDGLYEIVQASGTILGLPSLIERLKHYRSQNRSDLLSFVQKLKTLNASEQLDDDLSILEINFF